MGITTIHLIGALLSLVLGGWQLIQAKGTPSHKVRGRVWLISMAVTSVSSF